MLHLSTNNTFINIEYIDYFRLNIKIDITFSTTSWYIQSP